MAYARVNLALYLILFYVVYGCDLKLNSCDNDNYNNYKSNQNKSSERHLVVPKCMQCDKAEKVSNKRLYCIYCFELTHVRCVSFGNHLTQHENYWRCSNCFGKELPFYGVHDLDELDSAIPVFELENECYIDSHWEKTFSTFKAPTTLSSKLSVFVIYIR